VSGIGQRLWPVVRGAGEQLLPWADLLFPCTCIGCGGFVGEGRFAHLCDACRAGISLIEPPVCPVCGAPIDGRVEPEHAPVCPKCTDIEPAFHNGRSLFRHHGTGRRIVHELKYHHGNFLLKDIALLCERFAEFEWRMAGAVFVPVPLYPRKLRERGYNQSEWLARLFASRYPGARMLPLLVRVVDTQTQTRLGRGERLKNLRGVFAMRPGAVVDRRQAYVLVDDVYTTGATLAECSRVLRKAGARSISFLTLGHG